LWQPGTLWLNVGSDALIGATSVAALAGAAESALRKHQPVEDILRKLADALMTLRAELTELGEPHSVQPFDALPRRSRNSGCADPGNVRQHNARGSHTLGPAP
jgi:hypothetical protein